MESPTIASQESAVLRVQLHRQPLRRAAEYLLRFRGSGASSVRESKNCRAQPAVRIICISDTHNLRPTLPSGDLLIHAGDLTEWGTFDEVQAQLTWLSSQPYEHKILIAGNHDLLFDGVFLEKQPEHKYYQGRTRRDLDLGSVTYLQDESIRLSCADGKRALNIFGSPWTPQYGNSAFQYPREEDVWSNRVPSSTDILITHGPPARFNDIRPSAGCVYLRAEVARVKPELMVFGHIHVVRGEKNGHV
jgi:3',5'-cyclic AMP phosphodiesterase CpdA